MSNHLHVMALAAATLVASPAAWARHAETVCPNPPWGAPPQSVGADWFVAGLTGTPLQLHQTVQTPGTSPDVSSELSDDLVIKDVRTFDFQLPNATHLTGTLTQRIKRGTDDHCKSEWRVALDATSAPGVCVTGLMVGRFGTAGRKIVADYRDDLPGAIAPVTASRPKKSSFQFALAAPGVCPGQQSFPLLLNTLAGSVDRHAFVRMRLTGGLLTGQLGAIGPYPY